MLVTLSVARMYAPLPWTEQGGRLSRLTSGTPADPDGLQDVRSTYDQMGNVLNIEDHILGSPQTQTFEYDALYRLTSALASGGSTGNYAQESYSYDPTSGNLANDGTRLYIYDCANRLKYVSGGGVFSFGYNGLGDRVQQTVNDVTTNYAIDIALGLTQVMADDEHTCLYGARRIAQHGAANAYYFLTDALGSVRQLADADGQVSLAQSYRPFGEALSSSGEGATSYGFTGEWVDESELVYLRARYYSTAQGRFLSRDAWEGDYEVPMSYNLWLYTNANPVIYQDPTGMRPRIPCSIGYEGGWSDSNIKDRVDEAERYVSRYASEPGHPIIDPFNTYIAAGIAIQCAGTDIKKDELSSVGIAQVPEKVAETEWKEPVEDKDGKVRAYDLRMRCTNGELEDPLDPYDPHDAVELMKRRITMVTDECGAKCTATDIYIAAGLAQNGSGFTYKNMKTDVGKITDASIIEFSKPDVTKEWFGYFRND